MVTSFAQAIRLQPGEAIVFAWTEWPDKETRDRGLAAAMADPRMHVADTEEPIFDGKRLIASGFIPHRGTLSDRQTRRVRSVRASARRSDQEGALPLPEPLPGKGRKAFANLYLAPCTPVRCIVMTRSDAQQAFAIRA
jgi:hypothetical protein